jgi:1,2-diacylglycerol 3-alpha-glucosyltransferase
MQIGLFTDAYLPEISGVTMALHWLKQELEDLGHTVYIYAPRYPEVKDEEAHLVRFPARPFIFYKTAQFAFPYSQTAVRTFKTLDIVHSHTPFSLAFAAFQAALRYHIPHVHTYHTYLPEYLHYLPRPLRPPKRAAERYSALICNRCNIVTVPSTPIRDELIRYGVRRPIHMLPFGANLAFFQRDEVWQPRQDLGIAEDTSLIITTGRLAREKNLSFLLKTFATIHAAMPTTTFVLTGNGPERANLEHQVAQLGLDKAVIFTGFLDYDKLIDLYKAADLFLFASKTETQGLVLVEAMAGGTPVVAIGELGVLDIVKEDVNGILVPEDVEKYAQATLDLLGDRNRYEKLRVGALETAQILSTRNCTHRLLALYETCLSPTESHVQA